MKNYFQSLLRDETVILMIQSVPAMAVALFGGLVAMFHKPRVKMSVRFFIGGAVTSVFVGFLMDIGIRYFGGGPNLRVVCIALAGFSASKVLDIIEKKFLRVLEEVDLDD